MSSFRSPSSHNRTQSSHSSSPEKKPSLPVRVIRWTAVQVVSFILAVLILGIGYAAVTWTNIPSGSGASGQPVNQTLVQGIINNINYLSGVLSSLNTTINAVNTQLDTINPSGTTLSGSNVCINGDCKTGWPGSGTSGGTVTGILRWSSEYSGQTHTQAWSTCLALAPAKSWRIPTADEIEYGRRANTTLFTGNKNYWSSLPSGKNLVSMQYFQVWNPALSYWHNCNASASSPDCYGNDGGNVNVTTTFRCVSNI